MLRRSLQGVEAGPPGEAPALFLPQAVDGFFNARLARVDMSSILGSAFPYVHIMSRMAQHDAMSLYARSPRPV